MKTNTISMVVSKAYCLFHFQTEICLFSYFFHMVNIWPPKKMQFACEYFLGLFLWNLNILKILKKSLMGSIINSVKSLD